MSFAILIENLSGHGAPISKDILAHAIPGADESLELAKRLATSFPEHGFDPQQGSWWFKDDQGLHRLLIAPDAEFAIGHH
ncbi:MAG: hypothetical protein AVDCRST_MAG90-284 [uncultured Microvirga sp.]|uniref:Uncharacterized protein n=1 Tax=uncultured Microvirga sp. TaxID=412392 RepID=A0A6J4KL20_9HYPH|nr:MAG: hypothetical protein AVDCRST_MAG90-284 [uncultured Microvirga sp.]